MSGFRVKRERPGRGLTSDEPEDGRGHDKVEQGRGNETADDGDSDGVKNLFSRFARCEDKRDKGNPGGEGGHQNRHESLLRATDDEGHAETFPFVPHEMEVVGDHHDPVPRRNTADGDEADQRRDANVVDLPPRESEGSCNRKGQIEHHLKGEREALEVVGEQRQNDEDDEGKKYRDAPRRGLAGEILALKPQRIPSPPVRRFAPRRLR